MTTEERLKQYIDSDEVYQGYKNGNINLTDFEKFCIQHCKDIEEILEENQKYKETIDKAIDKLYCYGEILNADFQKDMLDILKEVK